MSEASLLVCGFADEGTGLGGVAWRSGDAGGGLLANGGAVEEASAQLTPQDDGSVQLTLDAGESRCTVLLSPKAGATALADGDARPPAGEPSAAICRARVELSGAGPKRSLECLGHLTRWDEDPLPGAELVRHLAIPAPDGGLLVLVGRGEPGGSGHDAEQYGAWILDGEGGARPFAEALLSTQYDEAGRQTRAGLELWPVGAEAPPMRAAGTVLGEAAVRDGVQAALLESSAEGFAGRGSYLIWRP